MKVKVFSATMARDRENLGDKITAWIKASKVTCKEAIVVQSSDSSFHCVTIVIFYE
jgi:hypothetical protein